MSCNANRDRLRGYRIKLYPTEDQKQELDRNIQIARAVYNLALEIENRLYNEGKPHARYFELTKIFSELKCNESFNWLNEVSLETIRSSLRNLDVGFEKFFSKITRYPKFKSRRKSKKNFGVRSDRTHVNGKYISISGLKNKLIKAKKHPIPEGSRMYDCTISFDGYDYWFSCCVETPKKDMNNIPQSDPIGIDVGVRNMVTTSNEEYYHFSNTDKLTKRLKRQQKRLSRDYEKYITEAFHTRTKYEDVPKSKNHLKRLAKQRKTYDRIRNKRYNDMNNTTKQIVERNPSAIVIENISVRDILSDPAMKKYAPQLVFYELHRQLKYKAEDRGIPIITAEKDYPSSRICSCCGFYHKPSGHIFKCPNCGLRMDRDYNAALNLKALAY